MELLVQGGQIEKYKLHIRGYIRISIRAAERQCRSAKLVNCGLLSSTESSWLVNSVNWVDLGLMSGKVSSTHQNLTGKSVKEPHL